MGHGRHHQATFPGVLRSSWRETTSRHMAPLSEKERLRSHIIPGTVERGVEAGRHRHLQGSGEYFARGGVLLCNVLCASVLRTFMTELEHGPEAFESVAKPFVPLLWRCARRLMRTRHEAEDLVQETWLKAFRAWHRLQPGTDTRAWLVTILLNTARDWARKTLRQPETLGLDELTVLLQQA